MADRNTSQTAPDIPGVPTDLLAWGYGGYGMSIFSDFSQFTWPGQSSLTM